MRACRWRPRGCAIDSFGGSRHGREVYGSRSFHGSLSRQRHHHANHRFRLARTIRRHHERRDAGARAAPALRRHGARSERLSAGRSRILDARAHCATFPPEPCTSRSWIPESVHRAHLLVAFSGEQAMLAPDNGLLAPLAARGQIDQRDPRRHHAARQIRRQRHERHLSRPRRVRAAGRGARRRTLRPARSRSTKSAPINQAGLARDAPARRRRHRGRHRRHRSLRQPDFQHRSRRRSMALAMPTVHIAGLRLPLRRTYGDAAAGRIPGPHQLL